LEDRVKVELDLNLSSVFYGLKYELPPIAEAGGAILNNVPLGGVGGIAGLGAYAAAKHGVVGLTRSPRWNGPPAVAGSARR
jgi:NAD(P)-dependent dehydrogenase (short-subunit alcohol dehydrogenase family)